MLSVLAPLLPDGLVPDAMQLARSIVNMAARARALAVFVPILSEPARSKILAEAMQAADASTDEWAYGAVLTIICGIISIPERAATLRQLVEIVVTIASTGITESDSAGLFATVSPALSQLASVLSESERISLLQPLLDFVRAMVDDHNRVRCLLALATAFSGTESAAVLLEGVQIVSTIADSVATRALSNGACTSTIHAPAQ